MSDIDPGELAQDILVNLSSSIVGPLLGAIPRSLSQRARARLRDVIGAGEVSTNHDLARGVRLAWIEAALRITAAARRAARVPKFSGDADTICRFAEIAESDLRKIRDAAYDRQTGIDPSPIDSSAALVLDGVAEFVSTGNKSDHVLRLTKAFRPALAAITGWGEVEIPEIFSRIALEGLPARNGGPRRPFGELLVAGFAELLKDPTGYPELREAFGIAARAAILDLQRRCLDSLLGLGQDLDRTLATVERTEDRLDRALDEFQNTISEQNRVWHGVPLLTGRADLDEISHRIPDRPSVLLLARYQVIPFFDRGGLLSELLAWATIASGPRSRARGRLYVAPGGFGKTRIGIELLATLADLGWRCTFLSPANSDRAAQGSLNDLLRTDHAAGACVVVDYAEGQDARLRELTIAAAQVAHTSRSGPPIRILALARSAEGWWNGFSQEPDCMAVFDANPYAPIADSLSAQDASTLFSLAYGQFAAALSHFGVDPLVPGTAAPAATDVTHDRPLLVAAAAYLSARGLPAAEDTLLDTLYQEERRHWRRALGGVPDDDPAMEALSRAAAQLTLIQGADAVGLDALLSADPSASEGGHPKTRQALRRLYGRPNPTPGATTTFGGIEPDLLGEHAAMAVFSADGRGLIETTFEAVLTDSDLKVTRAPENLLATLVRATHPDQSPGTVATAQSLVDRLQAVAPKLDANAAKRLIEALPDATILLADLALAVTYGLLATTRENLSEKSLRDRAYAQSNLGIRLSDIGRREDAVQATEEAIKAYRLLARDRPRDFNTSLARELSNLGSALSKLGRHQDALQATADAVGVYRQLASARLDCPQHAYAAALNNLGIRLSYLGRDEDAHKASNEAVEILQQLARDRPDAYRPALARAITSLGLIMSNLGRSEEALDTTKEAVEIFRELARDQPDAFQPDLARSLNNLGMMLSKLGRREAALQAAEQAVAIYMVLARARPDAFRPGLAMSLSNLGLMLEDLGRHEAALQPTEEAVKTYRQLAGDRPEAFQPGLARSLNNLGIVLSSLGRHADALHLAVEALESYRHLARDRPDTFRSYVATSLSNLGLRLADLGHHEAALQATEEAVQTLRKLADDQPASFRPDLARALNNLSILLSRLGRHEDAIQANTEALRAYQQLDHDRPETRPDHAVTLCTRGDLRAMTDQLAKAAESYAEGLALFRSEIHSAPGEIGPRMISSGNRLVRTMRSLGEADVIIATRLAEVGLHLSPDGVKLANDAYAPPQVELSST